MPPRVLDFMSRKGVTTKIQNKQRSIWWVPVVTSDQQEGRVGKGYTSTKFPKIQSTRLPLFFSFRNPLLLENRKFAVRIYMLVARTNPLLVFHYNFGYIKRCGQYYDENKFNREDLFRHVTEQDFSLRCLFGFGILESVP